MRWHFVLSAEGITFWKVPSRHHGALPIHTAGVCVMGCSVAISSSAYRLGGALTSNVLFESWLQGHSANPHCRSMLNELQCGDKLVRLSSWPALLTSNVLLSHGYRNTRPYGHRKLTQI